jgi:spore coat polysaccharide biosynthesis predicted glycosyltransferase SpsG
VQIAFVCDGDETSGAGHVGRCLPLAGAFAAAGHEPVFSGAFGGLAAWLLERAGHVPRAEPPVDARAIVADTYRLDGAALCALASGRPLATIGESNRCPGAGTVIDYHFGAKPAPDRLAGPAYAPIDPSFKDARRDRTGPIAGVLVTVGGSEAGRELAAALAERVAGGFPDARVLVPGDRETLHVLVSQADVAVAGAGVTAYELACAGVPTVLVELIANQAGVIAGADATGVALTAPADPDRVAAQLARLRDPELRARLQEAGPAVVDGDGAARAVAALLAIWGG